VVRLDGVSDWSGHGEALARADVDEQRQVFEQMLRASATVTTVLAGARELALPDWYLAAGVLFQTVWNHLTGRPLDAGIRDADLFYFDASDRSWEAEDAVIVAAAERFAASPVPVEVRNEARVPLWYEQKFGRPCPHYTSSASAIDSFASTTCCLGVRLHDDDRLEVYAPHGFADLFAMVLRPNHAYPLDEVYAAKAARYLSAWPNLQVLPWST